MDSHNDTMEKILKVHDDLVSATKELIKQTLVPHEKQIQHPKKEIFAKEGMNIIMQQVLIQVICSAQHFVDILNYMFDMFLSIFNEIIDTLQIHSPT